MENTSIFTPNQQAILSKVAKNDYLTARYYFTGGTALAGHYLKHRYSDDLDFFSEQELETDVLLSILQNWQSEMGFRMTPRMISPVTYRVYLLFGQSEELIIDFSKYQKRVEGSQTIDGIAVDSLRDIATNKLVTISQRTNVKDFVDLYFLLKDFDVWSLSYSMEKKFKITFEPYLYSTDFLKAEEFTFMPRMIKPLSLDTLQDFYRALAIRFGQGVMDE